MPKIVVDARSPPNRGCSVRSFAIEERELGPRRRAIEVRGELDLAVADQLKGALLAAMDDNDEVVVVLTECEFIDSTGIATLVLAHRQFSTRHGRLVLCEPTEQVRRVLGISGLTADGDFVFDTVEAALSGSGSD
jgi:anti-anti-sigma factor